MTADYQLPQRAGYQASDEGVALQYADRGNDVLDALWRIFDFMRLHVIKDPIDILGHLYSKLGMRHGSAGELPGDGSASFAASTALFQIMAHILPGDGLAGDHDVLVASLGGFPKIPLSFLLVRFLCKRFENEAMRSHT